MTDRRGTAPGLPPELTLDALAEHLGSPGEGLGAGARGKALEVEVLGAGDRPLSGVANLREAGPEELSFLTSARYRGELAGSEAGALLVGQGMLEDDALEALVAEGRGVLVVSDPPMALARTLAWLYPAPVHPAGSHPTAVVDPAARVDPTAHLGPFAVVGAGSEIGPGAALLAHAVVGRDCRIGPGALVHPHAVLYDGTRLGAGSVVHAGSVLGADGFGYVSRADGHHKVPQTGRVEIGDGVEVGALSAIDRATVGATRIGDGTKVDNLVQVGHNVQVGRGALLCGQAGIAGSTRLGDGVVLAGQAGVVGHLTLGDGVQVAAATAVVRSHEAGPLSGTVPAIDLSRWRRQAALLSRLDEMMRRLRRLEAVVERLPAEEERGE